VHERGFPPPADTADLEEVIALAAALADGEAPVEVGPAAAPSLPPLPRRRFPGVELVAVLVAVGTAALVARSVGDEQRATTHPPALPKGVSSVHAAPAPAPPPSVPSAAAAPAAVPAIAVAAPAGPPRRAPARPVAAVHRPAPKAAHEAACAGDVRDCPSFQQAMRDVEYWQDRWRGDMP
jgi:hypothetical protein